MKLSSSPAEVYPERASSSSTLGKSVRGNVMATPPARASAGLSTSRWTDLIRESWDKGSERGREAIAGDGDAASQDVTVPTPSEIAATLHSSTHTPQSMHNSSFTSAFSDTNAIASVGHTSTQDPQPVHFLISTCTVMNFSFLVLSMPNARRTSGAKRRMVPPVVGNAPSTSFNHCFFGLPVQAKTASRAGLSSADSSVVVCLLAHRTTCTV